VEVYKAVLMGKVSTIKQLERWKISQSN